MPCWKSFIFKLESVLLGLIVLLFLPACDRPPESASNRTSHGSATVSTQHSATFIAFGTTVSITLDGLESEQANDLLTTSNQMLMDWHHRWHPWQTSEITRLNDAIAQGQGLSLEVDTVDLLRAASALSSRSEGHFNPAIGGLVSLWGFDTDDYPVTSALPSLDAIANWLRGNPRMSDLAINDRFVQSVNPAVQIDTGGVAKGLAVDRLLALYQRSGVSAALINAGGDLRGYGQRSEPWRIAIRHPLQGGVLAGIDMIGDEALFTSGNYSRYKEVDSGRYSHILDPKTGWPVDRIVSATVVASSGLIADAAATALIVAPPEQTLQLMRQLELKHLLLIDESGCVRMDAGLQQRLHWQAGPPECLSLIDPSTIRPDVTGG